MRITFPVTVLIVATCLGCRSAAGGVETVALSSVAKTGPRVLCVVAHPDDEIAFAGTLFKTSTFLNGACDVALITNGEGGFKYATLGETVYGLELTDEAIGRAHLPRIRKQEFLAGCRLMGVRRAYFFGEQDHRYTQDPQEVLADNGAWDHAAVLAGLEQLMRRGDYDFLLTLAPTAETHGHHQAATILALRARERLAASERPIALCVRHSSAGDEVPAAPGLAAYPLTEVRAELAPLRFDRSQSFGFKERLNYKIVASWAIAEHKSQGTMQLYSGKGDYEHYFLFAANDDDAPNAAAAWFEALTAPQFETKTYGASAGTNAVSQ